MFRENSFHFLKFLGLKHHFNDKLYNIAWEVRKKIKEELETFWIKYKNECALNLRDQKNRLFLILEKNPI